MLAQTKLTKKEWEMVEIKVTPDKMEILEMMAQGYDNDKITCYKLQSLVSFLKLENTNEIDNYIYEQFFKKDVTKLLTMLSSPENITFSHPTKSLKNKVKKSDMIRITHNTTNIISENTYEYILLQFIEKLLTSKKVVRKSKSSSTTSLDWRFYYFTLYKIQQSFVPNTNKVILSFLSAIFEYFQPDINIIDFVYNAKLFIEKNDNLFRYKHLTLYDHQKRIVSACKTYHSSPKLVLYIAPTGTGKTLTPILLSSAYKVIYVCAAKHVGLSLAKSAISIHKKIAFAYGCSCPNDVKLHYFAAKEYTKNSKSGGIHKVDNSVGDKVEIIICDVLSYLPAMNYMLRFNESTSIITYFDEPTIFLDYPSHPSHDIIHKNWSENVIPNVILSSATLPKEEEIPETIRDFRSKFENSVIINIVSYECSKSIPLINKDGYIALPHYDVEELSDVKRMANHIIENPTILRYLDIGECVHFIQEFEKTEYCKEREDLSLLSNIDHLDKVELMNIKLHYLHILKYMNQETWEIVMGSLSVSRGLYIQPFIKPKSIGPGSSVSSSSTKFISKPLVRLSSISTETPNLYEKVAPSIPPSSSNEFGIYITTKDAHTLNDGPTIFLTNDIEKVSQFYIIQSNIPSVVMDDIAGKIDFNSHVLARIDILEKALDDINTKRLKSNTETTKIEKRMNQDTQLDQESKTKGVEKLTSELNGLSSSLKSIHLPEKYIPNKPSHIQHWIGDTRLNYTPFTSDIDEEIVERIMKLHISQMWKLLLLMGIGVFSNKHSSDEYTEIMKMLADNQQLYLIIASSDYIYGTNYQFCNCYISKNMELTQEKVIQAIGRVGRNNLQQNYSIRFRSNEHIQKLFNPEEVKQEAINMNLLFQSDDLSDM
jgi:hypothetical protein